MECKIFNTEANNALKANGIVYGLVMELALFLFLIPFLGYVVGLMLSFIPKAQYACLAIGLLIFAISWGWIKSKKKVTMVDINQYFLYTGSVKYIRAENYSLIVADDEDRQ